MVFLMLGNIHEQICVEVVYLPGCLVSLRCGSVSQGLQVHPQSCQCQQGWEADRPSPLPQSEGSTEAVTSCTPAGGTHTHTCDTAFMFMSVDFKLWAHAKQDIKGHGLKLYKPLLCLTLQTPPPRCCSHDSQGTCALFLLTHKQKTHSCYFTD